MPFQGYMTTLPGDFGIDVDSWLNIQNGAPRSFAGESRPALKYLGSGRDLAEYVHNDVLYQEYLNAALMLLQMGAPLNSGNPYPHVAQFRDRLHHFRSADGRVLVAEVMARAIKNAWFQKWFVHRVARPEETAGLVHFTMTGQKSYPLDPSVLNSQAAATVFAATATTSSRSLIRKDAHCIRRIHRDMRPRPAPR